MDKFSTKMALEHVAEQRDKWNAADREFRTGYDKAVERLLHEAAANRMSAHEVAESLGTSVAKVRVAMRRYGLNPKTGKILLAKQAAKALAENADLLGIDPREMDLTSPLAYLPMGESLRQELINRTTQGVTLEEFDELPDLGERPADCGCCTVVDDVSLAALKERAGL